MVNNIRFAGRQGRDFLMFVLSPNRRTAYLGNYYYWRALYRFGESFYQTLIATLSHETLHQTIERLEGDREASHALDKISNHWFYEDEYYGLPNVWAHTTKPYPPETCTACGGPMIIKNTPYYRKNWGAVAFCPTCAEKPINTSS